MNLAFPILDELLVGSIVALPVLLGTIMATVHLRRGTRAGYFRHLLGSIAAGAVLLGLTWSSLFGDSLSKSSTAGLIFAVAPFYAAIAQAIVYGLAALVFKNSAASRIAPLARAPMLIPLIMLAVFMFGLMGKLDYTEKDYEVAARTSDQATIQRLMGKAKLGGHEGFTIAIRLAANPATPAGMLTELAKDDHPAVRHSVVKNSRTPLEVVAPLYYDCSSFVRKAVVERLGPNNSVAPAPSPSGKCEHEKWR